MRPARARLRPAALVWGLGLLLCAPGALAPRAEDGPAPEELVHVPADELDVLLAADRQGIVLRYAEYARLLAAARERARSLRAEPPVDGAATQAEGVLDATGTDAARLTLVYDLTVLAAGPRAVDFPLAGLALESLDFEAGAGAYEEWEGRPRLRFEAPGRHRVRLAASAAFARDGAHTRLELRLPPAAAMALTLRLPPGMEGSITGEGAPLAFRTPPDRAGEVRARPARDGSLALAFAPAAEALDGPPVLDARTHTLHHMGDGLIATRAVLRVDVTRQPTQVLRLGLPPDLVVRALEGPGVTAHRRSEDRRTLTVEFERPVAGRLELTLDAELPFQPQPGLALPGVRVADAAREVADVAVRFDAQVKPRAVGVVDGRRVPVDPAGERLGVLVYRLFGPGAAVTVDLLPRTLRLEAQGTTYLNLGEAGRTLIATLTYRVVEGTLFRLAPRFPPDFELRELTLGGTPAGYTRERRPDGTVEIALARGAPEGSELLLAATLEQAGTDWVPEQGRVGVDLDVPSAGADAEDGFVAVGADAAFFVLEAERADLVAVGAGELTARGVNPAGLLYGYRRDGPAPRVRYEVERHRPLLDAQVVTTLAPAPRRVQVDAAIVHTIRRAGVRHLDFLVPGWVDAERVRVSGDGVRGAAALEGGVAPAGWRRWRATLDERRIGRHTLRVAWHRDLDREDWRLDPTADLGPQVDLPHAERFVLARRAEGLEVHVTAEGDVRALEPTELPPEAAVDALGLIEVLRLGADGRVGLAVQRHGGAAVLDAVATRLDVVTAVAREGVLRSRATVDLFNVDRQFLEVELPGDSELIGAIVDGQPVKPLRTPGGLTLVPVPTARAADTRTRVALTFETRLGGPVGGRLTVHGPAFPGLEVLETRHRIGLDPDLEWQAVDGDYGARRREDPPAPPVWLLAAFGGLAPREAAAPSLRAPPPPSRPGARDARLREQVQTDNDLPFDESFGRTEGEDRADAPFDGPATNSVIGVGGGAGGRRPGPGGRVSELQREAGDPTPRPPAAPSGPPPAESPAADPVEPAPGPAPQGAGGLPAGGEVFPDPTRAEPTPPGRVSRAGRRKGLLSLDVPVVLPPGGVTLARVGPSGVIHLTLATPAGRRVHYHLLGLAVLGLGLWLGRAGGWRVRGLVLLCAGGLALLLAVLFGRAAGVWVAGVANGATLLAGLWLAAGALRRLPRLLGRTAVWVGLALLAGGPGAGLARADEPRPPVPVVKEPTRVFVPYDPARPGEVDAEDRVFLPLATWLALFKAAHPDQDPELALLGRMAVVREAAYEIRVAGEEARGVLRTTLLRRGPGAGPLLVTLPLGGIAVSAARLDGEPVRLLLDAEGRYRVALERVGEARLEVEFHLPVSTGPEGRAFAFSGLPHAGARLDLTVPGFAGDALVEGRQGRMEARRETGPDGATVLRARAWLGAAPTLRVRLVEPPPEALPDSVRTRAESRTLHSVRDGGTETQADVDLHVLQGQAPFVDLALPAGTRVLEAGGPQVARWEVLRQPTPRLRVHFAAPAGGVVPLRVRVFRAAAGPERTEALAELAVLDTTGESGRVVVNADPALRLDLGASEGLFRTARPRGPEHAGPEPGGVVVGAWSFAARPAPLEVRVDRVPPRLEAESLIRVVLGDDHLRARLEASVRVERAPLGELVFALPGTDEVRAVRSPGLRDWWLVGEGDDRRLVLRYATLAAGARGVEVELVRRLGGVRENVAIPRWALEGAARDRGTLVLHALSDVEVRPGAVAGLVALPAIPGRLPPAPVEGATLVQAFAWEAPLGASLWVGLGTPAVERRAIVVTLVAPGDETHRLESLVLFDVRRGLTDRLALFVPDGGHAARDEVRTRDLREQRAERAVRAGPDGRETAGTLYELRLQAPRGGVIEVSVSQAWEPGRPVLSVVPEGAAGTRWFSLVRNFLDGEVVVEPLAPRPEEVQWAEIPVVPTGVDRTGVARAYGGHRPFALDVRALRRPLEVQAEAVVLAAVADAVVGLDGHARVRLTWRLFNRARQFLRFRLPAGAVLFGASSAGEPVKPLAGAGGTLLLPIPKVPLGGTGYEVTVLYRAPAGGALDGEARWELPLPEVLDVRVDRSVVRLLLPEGHDYEFDGHLVAAQAADVSADLAEVAVKEALDLLQVAERGTLSQRVAACENGFALLEQAKRLEAAAPAPVRDVLALRIQAAEKGWLGCRIQVQNDLAEAERQLTATGLRPEEFAGNAATLLVLEEEGETAPAQGRAAWRFNKAGEAPGGEAAGTEYLDLKKQIEGGLELRRETEQRKNVAGKAQRMKQEEAKDAYAAGASENLALGIAWLNDKLALEQGRNRQLGAATRAPPAPEAALGQTAQMGFQTRLEDLDADGRVGLEAGRYAQDLTDGEGRAAAGQAPRTQAGLMGVDVPLPRLGRVYYFRGEHAPGRLAIEASGADAGGASRTGVVLLLLLGAGLIAWRTASRRARAGTRPPPA